MAAAQLSAAADRLVNRVGHWTRARWAEPCRVPPSAAAPSRFYRRSAAPPAPSGPSRADAVFALIQRLADMAAHIEGRDPRAVPRQRTDLVLPDQLRVMVLDLLVVAPAELLRAATHDIETTGATL